MIFDCSTPEKIRAAGQSLNVKKLVDPRTPAAVNTLFHWLMTQQTIPLACGRRGYALSAMEHAAMVLLGEVMGKPAPLDDPTLRPADEVVQ